MNCSEKVKKAQALMQKKGMDAIVVLNFIDMFYFSGTIHGNLLLLLPDSEPILFGRRAVERSSRDIECGRVEAFKSFKEIRSLLPENCSKVGFIFDSTPVNIFNKVSGDLGLSAEKIVDISNDLKYLKMVKTDAEIELIRKAGTIVEKSYLELAKIIKPEMSEDQVAIELEYLLRKNGHLGENRFRGYNQIGLDTYVVSGENVNTPGVHDTPYCGKGNAGAMAVGASHKKLEPGQPFMIDTVGNYLGYHNDNTRTFIFGEPDAKIKKAYEGLLEIYHGIIADLKPGATCEEVYLKSLERAEKLGYKDHYMGLKGNQVGFMGHGIGIQVDEFPVFARRFAVPLEPGMTIALEPKLFFEDFGGVGIESTFVITEDGAESLSGLSENIFVL